jgi:hypothetical protein
MRKLFYLLSILMFSFSGKGSDRPEDVIRKAERSFAAVPSVEHPSFSRDLSLALSSLQPKLTTISKSGIQTISSEKFRADREKRNDRLLHVFNAGISMLSDYLYQAQNDDNLQWTNSIFPLGKKNGQDIPLDGYKDITLSNSVKYNIPNTWYCEINRQRNCLDLNHLLGLMNFWKKTIFSAETSQSYRENNALALKFQISEQIERRMEQFNQSRNRGLSDFGYRESIISILEDISDAIPHQMTGFITNASKFRKAHDDKTNEIIKIANEFLELSTKIMYIYLDPNLLITDHNLLKNFTDSYTSYLNKISKIGKIQFRPHIIDYKKIFSTEGFSLKLSLDSLNALVNHYIEILEEQCPGVREEDRILTEGKEPSSQMSSTETSIEPLKELPLVLKEDDKTLIEGALFSLHISFPNISRNIYNVIIRFLTNEDFHTFSCTNKYFYRYCSEILNIRERQIVYDDKYWLSENERHNKRKNNVIDTSIIDTPNQNVALTSYELDLFSFLKNDIFKVNRHLKKDLFMSRLSKLFFDVEVNKKGKGSLHYVLPKPNNPLFGKHKDESEYHFRANRIYFNIHLPHHNEAIPPSYFLYIQSGFQNVFNLSREYIDGCLKPHT